MRVIVFGAGAVGSVIGGRLRQNGSDVVLVARPAHAAAIRAGGLRLRMAAGTDVVDVSVVESLHELTPTPGDVVLITAKTQDTPLMHDAIDAWNPQVPVVCGTNGIEHERMALRRFPNVHGMCIQLPGQFEKPGEVTILGGPMNAVLDVGRYPSGVDGIDNELSARIDATPNMSSIPDPDVMVKKTAKLLVNLGNVPDAACGLAGRRAELTKAAHAEGKLVFTAAGIRCEPTPEATKSQADRMAQMKFAFPEGDTFLGGSTWQSIAKGATSLETDYFNGEVVLQARLHGLDAPVNRFLQEFAQRMLHEGIPAGSLTEDQLNAEWHAWSAAR